LRSCEKKDRKEKKGESRRIREKITTSSIKGTGGRGEGSIMTLNAEKERNSALASIQKGFETCKKAGKRGPSMAMPK